MNPDFYERLDLRMRRLETELSGLRAEIETQRGAAVVPPVPEPVRTVAAPPPAAPLPAEPFFTPNDAEHYRQMFGAPPPAGMHRA